MFVRKQRPIQRVGFTLVELLVVIAIIGTLIGLLLPAVQSAREAARRLQCSNNLKQIGIAIAAYTTANGNLPAGSYHSGTKKTNPQHHHMNWAIAVLPFLEQQGLYDTYHHDLYNSHPDNRPVLRTFLDVMECPTDNYHGRMVVPTQVNSVGPEGIATGSYKGISGERFAGNNGYFDFPGSATHHYPNRVHRGPLHLTGTFSGLGPVMPAHIRDGQSNTLLVGEYTTVDSVQIKATGTTFWASTHSFHNLGSPQREEYTRIADYDTCLKLAGNKFWQCDRAYASLHQGGVIQFVMCDGSVRGLSPSIDGLLFEDLGTINGQEVVALP